MGHKYWSWDVGLEQFLNILDKIKMMKQVVAMSKDSPWYGALTSINRLRLPLEQREDTTIVLSYHHIYQYLFSSVVEVSIYLM